MMQTFTGVNRFFMSIVADALTSYITVQAVIACRLMFDLWLPAAWTQHSRGRHDLFPSHKR